MIIIVRAAIWFSFLARDKETLELGTVFSSLSSLPPLLLHELEGWGKEQPCVILETLIDDIFQTNIAGEPTDCSCEMRAKKKKKKIRTVLS